MKKLLLSITIIIFSTFLFSCSKDDTASDSIDENGGQIYRYQVVTIDVGSTSLTNNVYLGTLAGTTVELTKVADHELVFYVPETTPIGATELHINSLNNAKINYEVKDVILTQSVDETLAPLETNFENYGNQLSTASQDIPFVQNHSTMMSYYNGLSIEEKSEVAKFYKVNKTIIDAVYNTDYSTIQGRNIDMQENRALVLRFKAALAVGMIGSAVAIAEPSNIIRPIAIGVAIAGISAAVDYHFELIDRNINIIEMKINALTGTNNRNTNSQLSLTENVATTLPFNVNVRPIQETDSNSQQEYMKLYFATKNRLNELISNINEAILWVNNAIPFVSFDTLPLAQVSSSANPVTADVTSQIMQKINFSISHPNLYLETATLQSNGQLNLKVKFVGNPTTNISSTLNYTYSDDFSRFSGSFPIVVNLASACGNFTDIDGNVYESVTIGTQCWMKSNLNVSRYRNGDIIPQVTDPEVWSQLTTGAWCYYEHNSANGIVYGKLYNWYAVVDPRGLAPEGYHIPTNSEWSTLTTFLGGESVAGGKLKSLSGWQTPNLGATNESGFSALPAGVRWGSTPPNDFAHISTGTYFWTSTSVTSSTSHAFNRAMYYNNNNCLLAGNNGKSLGHSVRCVKD